MRAPCASNLTSCATHNSANPLVNARRSTTDRLTCTLCIRGVPVDGASSKCCKDWASTLVRPTSRTTPRTRNASSVLRAASKPCSDQSPQCR